MTDPKQMSDEVLTAVVTDADLADALYELTGVLTALNKPMLTALMREAARRLRSGVAGRVPEGWRLDSIDNDGWDHNGPYTLTLARGKGCGLGNIRRGHGPTPEAALEDAAQRAVREG